MSAFFYKSKPQFPSDFTEIHKRSLENPLEFWSEQAQAVSWIKEPDEILDASRAPFYRWFRGGQLNTCYNAVDRHVEAGHGERIALIYDSPVTQTKAYYSYTQLQSEVASLAGLIASKGIQKGDRVIIYMPMIPQAVFAMLACARLGAVHSVVFGGFAGPELASRIDDAKADLILTASCGIEPARVVAYQPMVEYALESCKHKPRSVIVWQREQKPWVLQKGRDTHWQLAQKEAKLASCVCVEATDPLYILYTSGTTGTPKGVVRDNGGHAVALLWTIKHIYNLKPEDVFWAASDVGWVVGHSYICYAPLLAGATTLVYEGKPVGTPDPGAFWRVMAEHKVKVMFTAPTAMRAIKQQDPKAEYAKTYDLSNLELQFLAGERCDPDTLRWSEKTLAVPVIDHWWQTETGWAIAGIPMGIEQMPIKAGSANYPMVGWDVQALDAEGKPVKAGEIGNICIKLPLPPGTLPTIWGNEQRFLEAYLTSFPGYYMTGDAGIVDADGYVHILSRTDDIINVAGHRLSTGAIEEVLADHKDVAECAVIGVKDKLKGQIPLGLLILSAGTNRPSAQIIAEAVHMVRERIGPVAAFKTAVVVKRLPKTRSGKILRGVMRKIADGDTYKTPATLDDPVILEEIERAFEGRARAREQ